MVATPVRVLRLSGDYILDRSTYNTHPWHHPLKDLEASSDPTHQAVCGNWRMDHRVSKDRETAMRNCGDFPSRANGTSWIGGLRNHFQHSLCRLDPAILEGFNSINRIDLSTIPRHEQLIHTASLNGLIGFATSRSKAGAADLEIDFFSQTGFSLPIKTPGINWDTFNSHVDTLALHLSAEGVDAVKTAVSLLNEALGDTQPHWWACFAQEVMELMRRGDWNGLCRSLGMGHIEKGQWIVAWRYEVGTLRDLFRPTVVESCDSPFHFPSPPSHPYGVTMPLKNGVGPFREVVHPPLRGEWAKDACMGFLVRIDEENKEYYRDLLDIRQRHKKVLEKHSVRSPDRDWMDRHKKAP